VEGKVICVVDQKNRGANHRVFSGLFGLNLQKAVAIGDNRRLRESHPRHRTNLPVPYAYDGYQGGMIDLIILNCPIYLKGVL
jgi:hypothetical protein